ncbi:hypothetical protein [Streptomyces sp. NPDC007346]|uniref:hypothetical protein n=1 Tax=Streptomyces sp. NPDC007346 TaxID=3154682 RepID=UPI003452DE97
MYRTSPHSKPRRSPRTAAALATGTALAAVTLLAGPAAAAAPRTAPAPATHASATGAPEYVTRLVCTELAGAIGQLPPESVPVRVCKLVNGWD